MNPDDSESLTFFDMINMNGDEEEDDDDREYVPPEEEVEEDEEDDEITGNDSFLNDSKTVDSENEEFEKKSETDTIAKRTRSKLQIDEEPKDTLEFPDVTEDLYGTNYENDDDWVQFLNSLYQDNPSNIFEEDEANDPEYNVFEDTGEITDMSEDKFDVSQRPDQVLFTSSENNSKIDDDTKSTSSISSELSQFFNKDDLKLLYQQMAQHVQLLSQLYLLTIRSQTLNNIAKNAAFLLQEINQFGFNKEISIFKPLNLQSALNLIKDHPFKPSAKITSSKTWRLAPVPVEVIPIFATHPEIFIYHHLLPKCGYFDVQSDKVFKKTQFTKAEDHLITMGLEQLKSEKNCYKMIKNLLIPTKSEAQIRTHVKNKRRRVYAFDETNPISYYFKYNQVLPSSRDLIPYKLLYDDYSLLPEWLIKELNANNQTTNHSNPLPRYKLSLPKNFSSARFSSTPSGSPCKKAHLIIKKYKYLTKYPFIKPKPEPSSVEKLQDIEMKDLSKVKIIEEPKPVTSPKYTFINSQTRSFQPLESHKESASALDDHGSQNEDEDNESDLAALMVASTTITSSKSRNKSHESQNNQNNKKEGKKSLQMKQKESTNLLLSQDWLLHDLNKEQKEELMVQCFLSKVREVLKTDTDYIEFLECFSEFGESKPVESSIQKLHQNMQRLMRRLDAQKVMEEFVLLLTSTEAKVCDKMFEYLHWSRYLSFMRKLEVYSMVEPNCISRLQKALVQLKQNEGPINKQKLKSAVSKVINGHPYLLNEFSTLFLSEKPKKHLFAKDEDFDNVTITQVENCEEADDFENVNLSLSQQELKYGTSECPCKLCHDHQTTSASSNYKYSNISPINRHCVACSIRFIGGKVYLQGPKKMQTAEVQYLNKKLSSQVKNISSERLNQGLQNKQESNNLQLKKQEVEEEDKIWRKTDDKLLLELCKAKVSKDENNSLSGEVFEDIALRLNRKVDQVKERFQKLMKMFTGYSRLKTYSNYE